MNNFKPLKYLTVNYFVLSLKRISLIFFYFQEIVKSD